MTVRFGISVICAALLTAGFTATAKAQDQHSRIVEANALAAAGDLENASAVLADLAEQARPALLLDIGKQWRKGLPEAAPLRKPRPENAIPILERAAAADGEIARRALFELSRTLEDAEAARAALSRSALLGYPQAMRELGLRAATTRETATLLRLAMNAGDAASAFALADMVRDGFATGDEDALAKAGLRALKAGVAAGDPDAKADLGERLMRGSRITANVAEGRRLLSEAAASGHRAAIMTLASASLRGRDRDPEAAAEWYRRAAELGYADAAVELARMNFAGETAAVSAEEAERWLTLATEVDHPSALVLVAERESDPTASQRKLAEAEAAWNGSAEGAIAIARAYDPDDGFAPSREKARLWYELGAKTRAATALAALGDFNARNATSPEGRTEAVKLLRRAASLGAVSALTSLGEVYSAGPDAKPARALAFYREAAARSSSTAMNRAAAMLYDGDGVAMDQQAALAYWRDAADAGSLGAMTKLGRALIERAGGPERMARDDLIDAVGLLEAAARGGQASAMAELGEISLTTALGGPRPELAREWLRQAADAGRLSSLTTLARSYIASGDGRRAVEIYLEAAEAGGVDAMVELARAYSLGIGVERDNALANDWLRRADDAGGADPRTMEIIGRGYLTVDADAEQIERGVQLVSRAAERGNVRSMMTLARLYERGELIPADPQKALAWHLRAAEAGSVTAMVRVGVAYGEGAGVSPDRGVAFEWFNKAIEAGSDNTTALIAIGRAFASGSGVERDTKRAFESFERAAELGSVKAMELVASAYQRGEGAPQRPDLAVPWLERAAAVGSTNALVELGRIYASGYGSPVDQERAFRSFQEAAERGSRYAMREVGRFFLSGSGVERRPDEGVEWFVRAAELGEVGAMVELASIYRNGFVVEENPEQSVFWLRQASEAGSVAAKYQLAVSYLDAYGAPPDRDRAIRLLREAASEGETRAARLLATLEESG